LFSRIREIRASERRFNQKITDIYATSFDYNKDADITKNSQLASNPLETIPRLISATKKLDQATKTAVFKTVHLLVKTTVETFSRNS